MFLIHERTLWSRQYFDPSCPSGGTWYACTFGTKFVGCCTGSGDPCDTGCAKKNLKPASFNESDYGTFPDQDCSSGSDWYTCGGTDPTFMGCCKSNPCSDGCPTANLTAGILSNDTTSANPFTITSSSVSSTATLFTSAAATTNAATTTTAAAATSSAAGTLLDHSGAIAGGVVGGVAALGLILVGFLWWLKKARTARKKQMEEPGNDLPVYEDGDSKDNFQPPSTTGGHSQEFPEGIEVSDQQRHASSPGHLLSPEAQKVGTDRSSSRGSGWPYRSSIATFSPIFTPGEGQQFPGSYHEGQQQAPPWHSLTNIHSPMVPLLNFPIASQSPVQTHIQHQHPDQADYFGSQATDFARRQRPVSYELLGSAVKDLGLPQAEFFELEDTQMSLPVELEAGRRLPEEGEDNGFPQQDSPTLPNCPTTPSVETSAGQTTERPTFQRADTAVTERLTEHSRLSFVSVEEEIAPSVPFIAPISSEEGGSHRRDVSALEDEEEEEESAPPLPWRQPYSPDDIGSQRRRGGSSS